MLGNRVRRTVKTARVKTDQVQLKEQPTTPGRSRLWMKNDTPQSLIFTDDEGTDSLINDQTVESLTDVNVTSVADGDILSYDAGTSKWINVAGTPTLSSVLTGGNDGTGLDIDNIGQLTFDTTGISIGTDVGVATTTVSTSIAIGNLAAAVERSIAIGRLAISLASDTVCIGGIAQTNVPFGVALGYDSSTYGPNNVCIGRATTTSDYVAPPSDVVLIGFNCIGHESDAVLIGSQVYSYTGGGTGNIAIGRIARVNSGNNNLCIGTNAISDSLVNNSVAIGKNSANAYCDDSISVGYGTHCSVSDSVALGTGAYTTAPNSIVIGYFGISQSADSIVIGWGNPTTNHIGSIMIGIGSTTSDNQLVIKTSSYPVKSLRTNLTTDGGTGAHNTDADRLRITVGVTNFWIKLYTA